MIEKTTAGIVRLVCYPKYFCQHTDWPGRREMRS